MYVHKGVKYLSLFVGSLCVWGMGWWWPLKINRAVFPLLLFYGLVWEVLVEICGETTCIWNMGRILITSYISIGFVSCLIDLDLTFVGGI